MKAFSIEREKQQRVEQKLKVLSKSCNDFLVLLSPYSVKDGFLTMRAPFTNHVDINGQQGRLLLHAQAGV